MTPGIGRIHPRPHLHLHLHLHLYLHLQLRRANLTERGLLANPNTCISTLACTNLKPRSSHSDLSTQERDIFRNTSFSATEANIQRHLCRRLRAMVNRIPVYIPFGLVYCGQPSSVGVQKPWKGIFSPVHHQATPPPDVRPKHSIMPPNNILRFITRQLFGYTRAIAGEDPPRISILRKSNLSMLQCSPSHSNPIGFW